MFQKIVIVGNLGRDPEMRYTPSGTPVCRMGIATNRRYTNGKGESIEEVTWFQVAAWGKQAEACSQYLRKGSQVLVEGRLTPDRTTGSPRTFERQDGSVGSSYEVSAETVRFLGGRRPEEGPSMRDGEQPATGANLEEEIPF